MGAETFLEKSFWLIDAWEGLKSYSSEEEGEHVYYYPVNLDSVRPDFAMYPNIKFIKGILPTALADLPADRKFSFVHINTGDYAAELECVKTLWSKVVAGGVLLIDGYACAMQDFDELFSGLGVYPLVLLSGQAIIVKLDLS